VRDSVTCRSLVYRCEIDCTSLCRERLWRLFVEDIKLERDDPAAASRRGRVSLAGRLQLLRFVHALIVCMITPMQW